MKRRILQFGLVVVVCLSLSALADTVYSFQTAFVPGDTFTQLLGTTSSVRSLAITEVERQDIRIKGSC